MQIRSPVPCQNVIRSENSDFLISSLRTWKRGTRSNPGILPYCSKRLRLASNRTDLRPSGRSAGPTSGDGNILEFDPDGIALLREGEN